MPKKVLVTGSNGQLGSELQALAQSYREYDFLFVIREELDFSKPELMVEFFKDKCFDVIINCAAYTAVDQAESDEKMADLINHQAVKHLAIIAKEKAISLIHISTDYVFDGTNCKPYLEEDNVSPKGIYGQTKREGENTLLEINPKNSIIIRTSWVYSSYGNNFVKTMLRLGQEREELSVVFDQIGSPTYARDLARTILNIIPNLRNKDVEIYHYSNEGVCSWYDFAKSIFELSKISCKVNPIETSEYPTPATRPHYSLLNKSKIKREYNIAIPYWKDSLSECLKRVENA